MSWQSSAEIIRRLKANDERRERTLKVLPDDIVGGGSGPHNWIELASMVTRRRHFVCSCGARKVGKLVAECNESTYLDTSDRGWLSGAQVREGDDKSAQIVRLLAEDPAQLFDDERVRQEQVDRERFLNRLRILRSIDHVELIGGLLEWTGWTQFRNNPAEYLISCSDDEAEVIWTALRKRER